MKASFQNNGLSARRKTVDFISNRVYRPLLLLTMMGTLLISCQKIKGQTGAAKGGDSTATWSANAPQPKTDIQVNRRYDDKGNGSSGKVGGF
jgi:hypothetical protein